MTTDERNSDYAATLLSHSQCEEILAQFLGEGTAGEKEAHGHLLDFHIETALDVMGFLGEYYHLSLRYTEWADENQNFTNGCCSKIIRLFVKSLPLQNDETAKEEIFRKEANLYVQLLRELQKISSVIWSPKCYYSRSDLFVLQDLKAAGYMICSDLSDKLTDRQMQQILRSLAALHASSIAYEVKNGLNIGDAYPHLLQEITIAPHVAWFTTGIQALLVLAAAHPRYQSKEMQNFIHKDLRQHLERVYDMTSTSTKYTNVLCHRDPWRGNVFFGYDRDESSVLVDFQTVRYCPPSIDVIFALFMNLDPEKRKAQESDYIAWYYHHFERDLIASGLDARRHMTAEDFVRSYREFELIGHVYNALAATIIKVPREFVTNEYKHIDRSHRLLAFMQENHDFQAYMENCIDDIVQAIRRGCRS